jgi:hypothetical protein
MHVDEQTLIKPSHSQGQVPTEEGQGHKMTRPWEGSST